MLHVGERCPDKSADALMGGPINDFANIERALELDEQDNNISKALILLDGASEFYCPKAIEMIVLEQRRIKRAAEAARRAA